jgi:hypothetical protein
MSERYPSCDEGLASFHSRARRRASDIDGFRRSSEKRSRASVRASTVQWEASSNVSAIRKRR